MEKQVDLEGMREAVQKRVSEEAAGSEKVDVDPGSGRSGIKSGGPPVDPGFIKECLEANQLGDGILYATLHEGKLSQSPLIGALLRTNGRNVWFSRSWTVSIPSNRGTSSDCTRTSRRQPNVLSLNPL